MKEKEEILFFFKKKAFSIIASFWMVVQFSLKSIISMCEQSFGDSQLFEGLIIKVW